ncbi:hypothetical protein [Stenotrophomonas sp. SY1]|uniref:hypothetical protein n=1 Tax=Stenotrophomonas sp. SY1 TaxID=477235 RepID=UPI001E5EE0F5|nr:hypothetical protein [Stenotrophomonas sp. SY1]MCD9086213.1 hypothetical protein [Stenotrophomonas sp. SY1]
MTEALGPFDLDPCAAPSPRPWPTAAKHIELPEDGLTTNWHDCVWCNPPFGQYTKAWLQRLAEHANGIALAFARRETGKSRRWVWPHASGVLFLPGGPNFHYPDGTRARGNSGGPICLVAYGDANRRAQHQSGLPGALVALVADSPQEASDA